MLMVYIDCKYFFNLSLKDQVKLVYFRYSENEHQLWESNGHVTDDVT